MTLTDWLSEQEKICEAAAYGPWKWCENHKVIHARGMCAGQVYVCRPVFIADNNRDMNFIAQSRTALPQALQVIRELREALRKIQFNFETDWKCETCKQVNEYCYKPIAVALARADEIVKGSEG